MTLFASPDGTLSASDVAITTVSSGALKLKTGASKTISVNYNYPTGLASGSYRIVAVVNSSNSLAETNYTDNTSASTPVTIAPAFVDLMGAIITAPKVIFQGKVTSVSLVVSNGGNSPSTGGVSITMYQSPIPIYESSNLFLGRVASSGAIKGGGHGTFHVRFKAPLNLTTGYGYLIAVINNNTDSAAVSNSAIQFS